ncbi:MAG: hypothetical protein AAGA68_25960 [Pseudomonadota bacterium]
MTDQRLPVRPLKNQVLRRRIFNFDDLRNLVEAGLVTSFATNGPSDGLVAGLNSAEAVITAR